MRDVKHTIYEAPLMLQAERVDQTVCDLLGLDKPAADMTDWRRFVNRVVQPKKSVKIAIVGKYIEHQDAYKSIYESLTHAAASHDSAIDLLRIDAEALEAGGDAVARVLEGVTGIVVPGGFGERGIEGKIQAAGYARVNKVPYLGLCLGMQVATIEFARNACGLEDCQQHRVRPEDAASGDFPVGTAAARAGEGCFDAVGSMADDDYPRHAGRAGVRPQRDPRAPPPPLRIQQRLP